MDPRFPRRHTHTVHEQQGGRDVTIVWVPGQGVRAVEHGARLPLVLDRPETWPAEGETITDEVLRG